jgi:hypothetical protein
MAIDLDGLEFENPQLELTRPILEVDGKRGNVRLEFCLKAGGETVGRGEKAMVISGLRAYDEDKVQAMVDNYTNQKRHLAS